MRGLELNAWGDPGRNAKAVNFGVYGISLGLSNIWASAKEAIVITYFERFPGIKNYMDEAVREARDRLIVVVSC